MFPCRSGDALQNHGMAQSIKDGDVVAIMAIVMKRKTGSDSLNCQLGGEQKPAAKNIAFN
jgi:hypothetical protein